jgi:dihydropteroate synthase
MRKINLKKVQLMGIINLTPDSFSDGGKIQSSQDCLSQAKKLLSEGATILDLGAESTGPDSVDVDQQQELDRLVPSLKALVDFRQQLPQSEYFQISIDTYKSQVAKQALELGADIINDITALRQDPNIAKVLANSNCKVAIMYSKDSTPRTTKTATEYPDVIKTIIQFFEERITYANQNGITTDRLILDPGMGAFISTIPDYSYEILERLTELKTHFSLPILIGTSLKSMHPFPLQDRLIPSVITATLGAVNGADILRVHNVKEHKLALQTLSHQ